MSTNANNYVDEVINNSEGQLRMALLGAGLARKFDASEYAKFLGQLATADQDPALATEIVRASNTTYDQAPDIDLDTSSRQLLWAATLLHQAHIAAQNKKDFSDTPFFRHIVNQPVFQQELLRYAHTLSDHFDRNKTRIRWGTPLSWFYFSPDEKIINIDPFHSLVFGLPRHPQDFAHSRAPAFHEVGHAILSAELPKPFQEHIDRLKEFGEKDEPLTTAEQEEFLDRRIEAMLWGQFYNLAEDNVVNRFAIILGRYRHGQNYDYAESLKYIYAFINQSRKSFEDFKIDQWSRYVKSGRDFLDKLKASSAIEQLNAITKVLGLTVPVNEGLFENEKTEWEKSGLNWAAFMPSLDDAGKIGAASTLLTEGDGKPSSISYQQPYIYRVLHGPKHGGIAASFVKASERFFRYLTTDNATIHSPEEIKHANEARNVIIEHLWQKYVLPLLPQIKAEIRQQLQQAQQSMQNMADQIPGPPSSGMSSPGGGKSDKKPKQDAKPENKGNEGDKSDKKDKPGEEGSGDKTSPEPKPKNGKDSDPDKGSGKNQNDDKNKGDAGGKNKDKGEDGDKGIIGDENNPDLGKLIGEIIKTAARQDADEGNRQAEREGQLQAIVNQAQQSTQPIKYDFPEGDWSNYQGAKQRLAWLTSIFVRQLEDIRKKQVELQVRRGRRLEILPESGEMDRLDREAHFELTVRAGAQVPMRVDDYKRFVGNKTAVKFTTPQMVLLVDGSGSMGFRMNGTQGAVPVDIAISTGLALYEASNQINSRVVDPNPAFECYSGIWGPNNPSWLTWPGLEPTQAGKNLDRFRKGLQSNTNLAPALGMVSKKLSTENSSAKNIGATHLLILSDGDIQDSSETTKKVIKLVENVRNLTVDIVLISAQENPEIVQVFRRVKGQYPNLNYGVHRIDDLDQMPFTCLKALRQRMTQEVLSTPRATKAAQFKRATLD